MKNALVPERIRTINGSFFQVLSLPAEPVRHRRLLRDREDMQREDPATISQIIQQAMERRNDQ